MTSEKERRLKEDFPELYGSLNVINCDDGWEPLIRRLSERLESLGVKALQVKEKFGTLRFYLDMYTDEAEAAIAIAEEESARTCERCGAPGLLRDGSWVLTLCDACDAERNK